MKLHALYVAALCAIAASTGASASTVYTVTNLGTLGGNTSLGLGINKAGTVVGVSAVPSGAQPFIYKNGAMSGLDIPSSPVWGGYAQAINDSGQIAGFMSNQANNYKDSAYLYSNDVATPLGTFGLTGSVFSEGKAINASGQITGSFGLNSSVQRRGFVYSNGTVTTLGTLGGTSSRGTSINDSGTVVGYSDLAADMSANAFSFTAGVMTDLGTLGGVGSVANAINIAGQITGTSTTTNGQTHAFLSAGGALQDIGTLGSDFSWGNAINSVGAVVGRSYTAGYAEHAFLYAGGVMTDLSVSLDPASGAGWDVFDARAINDSGWIVATGRRVGTFETMALLLTPVPEPSKLALIVLGLGALGWRARSQR